jgi:hypothetical protein
MLARRAAQIVAPVAATRTAAASQRLTDPQMVHQLVHRYVTGCVLPATITVDDGTAVPLLDWLGTLRHDRTEFSTDLSSRLGLQTNPAYVCEAALTLHARLIEAAR